MNIEKIFRKTNMFENIEMDFVLVESKYSVWFTCRDKNDVYLFICCLVNSQTVKWIGTKTTYEILISLLKDGITIREAFLNVCEEKIIIEYYGPGKDVEYEKVNANDIPEKLLPTYGEYMEAEEGEFEDELRVFQSRALIKEVVIKPQTTRLLFISPSK